MPERKGSPETALDERIRDVEYQAAIFQGIPLYRALQAVGQLCKDITEQELVAFIIERHRCHAVNAAILVKALKLFWEKEFLACAYLIVPFVEAGARTLLLELNEPIYRIEVGKTKGQYAPLGALLPRLEEEGFDHDWVRFLQALLLNEGQNYRNDIAHGFLRQVDPIVAVRLLRAGALFLTMSIETATESELAELKARPTPRWPSRSRLQRVKLAIAAAYRELRRP